MPSEVKDLCEKISKLEEKIDGLFSEYETSSLSEDELRKVFEEPLSRYKEVVDELLRKLGVSDDRINIVNDALDMLIEDSGMITDPDPHDYWWSGWRFLASVIGMLCGKQPYLGAGAPDEEFGEDYVKALWRLPCEVRGP
ncbi:hypothetical protein [Vulcanisaeta distributa]|uniref:Uncharacterized protein n=1 Tax=Vulcanisaeta distributa (strain DSM 14429 / JCM 11212 / NBRC 100878 / IC-017) TaxID=572478 RepID=E1QST4_VULDI|nr:hypothetical protein [Vulcanisaeta distributa]ADN49601.1 hypothetical protein Vdis_0188 [Vulcanisaeta distributa DSM 14429]